MFKVLNPILKGTDYNPVEANQNLWGIISPADKYLSHHNAAFAVPVRRSLFDKNISKDAPNTIIQKAEAEHTDLCNDHALYNAAKNGFVNLFHTIVDETWYQDLKDANTYYSEVTETNMLVHFRTNCSIIQEVDAITIQG